jgi:membrane complex biogenesis BtpA family protein
LTKKLEQVFGTTKPVIAMVHLDALPGTVLYDDKGGIEAIVRGARADIEALQSAGVDAIMFGNENDRPYQLDVDVASTATMAYVIGRLRESVNVPFGVNVLWDPVSTMALATATGGSFVREIFTGLYGSDMGLWQGRAAEALRYARALGRADLFVCANISAEFASSLDSRSLGDRARSAVFSSLVDAVLVSGPITGEQAPLEHMKDVKRAVPDVPVFANTGVTHESVGEILDVVDGVIVGTALKKDGVTWNPVDQDRARRFMKAAHGE